MGVPHPRGRAVDGGEPPSLRRPYWDHTPQAWTEGAETGNDHPVTTAELFTSFTRANFRVDTILEPEPPVAGVGRSRWWHPAMGWLPSTLIVRARKVGT